ncbi:MAG TPA: SRPBCC domain-containing protein [Rhizomicrobium sp.]|nr:SRPBCC domain-containing protein [Rhizomicrobium sp.]
MRNWKLPAVLAAVMALTGMAPADPVHDTSFKEPNGDRVLQLYVDVKAAPQCVWRSFTDEEGIKAFGLKLVHVDMRNGGTIEEGFSETAKLGGNETIRHHIIAYLPERLLVLQNEATPPGPPHAELYRNIVQVITVEPRGKQTRLTISHTGYGTSAEYDQLYAFFHNINHGFLKGVKSFCETKS